MRWKRRKNANRFDDNESLYIHIKRITLPKEYERKYRHSKIAIEIGVFPMHEPSVRILFFVIIWMKPELMKPEKIITWNICYVQRL